MTMAEIYYWVNLPFCAGIIHHRSLRMFQFVLLFLAVSGLQALPIGAPRPRSASTFELPDGFRQETGHQETIPDSFKQGTEPSRRFLVDLNTGLVKEDVSEMDRRVVPEDVPAQRNGGGWVRVEEASVPDVPDGYRQGTEPFLSIRDGFKQGTEPFLSIRDGFKQGTEPFISIRDGFKQGTEPFISIRDGFKQGTEPFLSIRDGFKQGTEPFISIRDGFKQGTEPFLSIRDGFKQGTEPFISIRDGFKQGTEPFLSIRDGFKQGTEPFSPIRDGFKQGTEPFISIRDGFKQGTEPFISIRDGFKQGTEPFISIRDGFKQGTEPFSSIRDGFKQGTEPFLSIRDGFKQGTEPFISFRDDFKQGTEPFPEIPLNYRQGTEPSNGKVPAQIVTCTGDIISEHCYEFIRTPLAFQDAQDLCRALAPKAELASVTSGDLHSRLVSLVTKGGQSNPVLTWLGGKVKNQQASWTDGSEWSYSDWMPGQTLVNADKPACVQMFKIDKSWWTVADCELKRASICSYPITG